MIIQTDKDLLMVLNYRINCVREVMKIHSNMGIFDLNNAKKLYPKRIFKKNCYNIIMTTTKAELLSDPKKTAMLLLSLMHGLYKDSYSHWLKERLHMTHDSVMTHERRDYCQWYWSWWLSPQNSQLGVVRMLRATLQGKTWEEATKF